MENNNPVALQRVSLININPNLSNVLIVGIIIGKTKPRTFLDTKATVQTYKSVWNFTLRDSKTDYINVSYWGESEIIYYANDQFRTGDVGKLLFSIRITYFQIYYLKQSVQPIT